MYAIIHLSNPKCREQPFTERRLCSFFQKSVTFFQCVTKSIICHVHVDPVLSVSLPNLSRDVGE